MKLHTIGYTGRTIEGLCDKLQAAGVRLLLDIRSGGWSAQLQFRDDVLELALDHRGIAYRRMFRFGNPFRPRPGAPLEFSSAMLRYRTHVEANAPLDLLRDYVQAGDACLLCACPRWDRCHRSELAAIVAERVPGLEIAHM